MHLPTILHGRSRLLLPVLTAVVLAAAGCGSSSNSTSSSASSSSASSGAATGGPPSAGQSAADAKSAATGDIPDNQQFLTFNDAQAAYSIRYPEGWTQKGMGADVSFREKDNSIQVRVARAAAPTSATVVAQLDALKAGEPTLKVGPASTVLLPHGGQAVKVSYSIQGAADAVTGKRPLLLIDRYVYSKGGRVATLDLASPKGVDNVDAYRMISRSFTWQ